MVQGSPGQVLMHRAAVLGKPIEHSLSPVLHHAAYNALGLTDWEYTRHQVDAHGLEGFVAGLDHTWRGLSLTMPLKEQALLMASSASSVALRTGSVNTLVRSTDGWFGDNTDVHGIRQSLADAGLGIDLPGGEAVVIGSGATARSVLAALATFGVRRVTFLVRSRARESTLAQARDHGMTTAVRRMPDGASSCAHAALVVSTVPAAAADGLAAAIQDEKSDSERITRPIWLDVVYAGWPTMLARVGAARGAVLVPGIEMLIHQAAQQVRLMTGLEPPLAAMQAAGRAAVSSL
ncbi:shikimate dehydrogenase [Leekyejoonella antrihumi]|uniref:Shikimate dehydrogenase n=1 Tax=Leekyejoonella antrihumi TaxID=1660198 RepID=A0A563DXD1_9MICO|nr:shikimate dehydrogenase [Leekyejoonella antrihumi]TWP34865.1 shikimate dehydrogenase [Leekyejoonella antrihumi]